MASKKAFGEFVADKRRAGGLSQRELAERLFVTTSAVSKWERGVSYPDISLVAPLAALLGVSEGELIKATDDPVEPADPLAERDARQARVYRRWKAAIWWTTTVAYVVTLMVCLTVNLAVDHTLSWFFTVLAALLVAASLTTLPLWPSREPTAAGVAAPGLRERSGWVVGAFVASLLLLFVTCWLQYGRGPWLPIAAVAVLLAVLVVLGPIVLAGTRMPVPYSRHRTVIALGLDTIGLFALLLVIFAATQRMEQWWTRVVPAAGLGLVFVWGVALIVRYLPVRGLFRASAAVGFVALYDIAFVWTLDRIVGGASSRPVDLTRWHGDYINGNVGLLATAAGVLVAVALAVAGAVTPERPRRGRR